MGLATIKSINSIKGAEKEKTVKFSVESSPVFIADGGTTAFSDASSSQLEGVKQKVMMGVGRGLAGKGLR